MRRHDLLRVLEGFGCVLVRHGGKHDWYRNPSTGMSQPVPRHRDIKEGLASHIIKALSNPVATDSPTETSGENPA